jgi:hypothetical protein
MNADVFITIAFCGTVVLLALAAAAFVVADKRQNETTEEDAGQMNLAPRFGGEGPATGASDVRRPRLRRDAA